ncbi:MAG: hypothetical protein LBT06_17150 [Hungatella sp.]|jgi:hypothetical protein|nr:hypothetical protein [Hungatella sp.]
MENLYPLFERNRILKKELLWSLRDYSFAHIQLEYQEHGQGILRGCDISVQGKELVISPGILKYGKFVCLLTEEERISFAPAERMQYLRLKAEVDKTSPDYIAYRMEYFLTSEEEKKENEFELCRFCLSSGARLRDKHRDFTDMGTQYDTVGFIHADWGGLGGKTLAPAITRCFARTILESGNSQPEDRSFAYLCMNQLGAVPAYTLTSYLRYRSTSGLDAFKDNQSLYQSMCAIVASIGQGSEKKGNTRKEKHRILVD